MIDNKMAAVRGFSFLLSCGLSNLTSGFLLVRALEKNVLYLL